MLSDFIQWTKLVDKDYTLHDFYNRTNTFTFNYGTAGFQMAPSCLGFWRGVYRHAFDTDRSPHNFGNAWIYN